VESGRHAELLARQDSVYAKLYATQVFDTHPARPVETPVRGREYGFRA
jgi:hypothetical protein